MFKKTLVALTLAAAATGSFSQVYVQAGVGNGNVSGGFVGATATTNSATGSKFVIGYQINKAWSLEVNSISYGKAVSTAGTQIAQVKVDGYGVGGAFTTPISKKWDFRIGAAVNQNTAKSSFTNMPTSTPSSTGSTTANVDLGVTYKFTPTFGAIIGIDVSSFKYQTTSPSSGLLSVGLRANF
jgi:Outer membrane protein beta-barrel domain